MAGVDDGPGAGPEPFAANGWPLLLQVADALDSGHSPSIVVPDEATEFEGWYSQFRRHGPMVPELVPDPPDFRENALDFREKSPESGGEASAGLIELRALSPACMTAAVRALMTPKPVGKKKRRGVAKIPIAARTCRHCAKIFESRHKAIRHERVHTGEKPFRCEACSKAFTQKSALKKHSLRHAKAFVRSAKASRKECAGYRVNGYTLSDLDLVYRGLV